MVHAGENSKTPMTPDDLKDPAQQHWSVRTRRWRYIRYNNGAEELYDHENDPHEWQNLAQDPDQATVLKKMRQRLQEQVTLAM